MIRKLANLLRLTARDLEEISGPPPAGPDLEESGEEPAPDAQVETAPSQEEATTPSTLWQSFVSAERAHLSWLWSKPYLIVIALGLAALIFIAERRLIQAWDWLVLRAGPSWPDLASRRVALIGIGIILFILIFGLRWLRYIDEFVHSFLGGVKRRPQLSALVGVFLLLIVLWIANNYGIWVVLPFVVGQTETVSVDDDISLNCEKVAIQLIAELNQVGVCYPQPYLNLYELREPYLSGGSVTSRDVIPLEECDAILPGPGEFSIVLSVFFLPPTIMLRHLLSVRKI